MDDPGTYLPFGLTSRGEAVHLIAGDRFGRMQGYSDSVYFDATRKGVTMGRFYASDGDSQFVASASSSIGSENLSQPLIGPIVIDQVLFHAKEEMDNYIRIVNVSGVTMKLSDTHSTWMINGGISFAFSSDDELSAGQHGFVAATDPATIPLWHSYRRTRVWPLLGQVE